MNKELRKSRNNRVIGGVIGGFAETYHFDATLLRIIYAALTIFSAGFPGVLLYIIAALVMPER